MNQTILNERRRVLAESAALWRETAMSDEPWEKPDWAYNKWYNGCACCQYTFKFMQIDETPRNEYCRVLCPAAPLWRGEFCQHSKALYDRWVRAGEGEEHERANRRAAFQLSWAFQALFNDMAQCVGD